QTACGRGQASSGPFYCPGDQKVYLDISFYNELSTKYGAKGDFAMAYVIAHEVGHHIQNELGIMDNYASARQGKSKAKANQLNVKLELQADYYAGAWANYVQGQGLLEKGDIEEAMAAAHAVGDDTLQEETYGRAVPDSFTHGTSKQRQRWFDRGYQYGDFEHGDTFSIPYSKL
ncbi:neutral zinc metallopeptidase, partial [Streptococcus pyogenes]